MNLNVYEQDLRLRQHRELEYNYWRRGYDLRTTASLHSYPELPKSLENNNNKEDLLLLL